MRCYWCSRECLTLTKDHVIPRSRGGSSRLDNLVQACADCNHLKGDMLPSEWSVVMRDIPEWWRLNRLRGPRGRQLAQAMRECGFNFDLASNGEPYEPWWETISACQ